MPGLTIAPLGTEGMPVSPRVIGVLKRLQPSLSPFRKWGHFGEGAIRDPQLFLFLPEGGGKIGAPLSAFHEVAWEVGVPRGVLGLLK